MKVKELIEKLQAFDGELNVYTTIDEDYWYTHVNSVVEKTVTERNPYEFEENEISHLCFNLSVEDGEKVILIN